VQDRVILATETTAGKTFLISHQQAFEYAAAPSSCQNKTHASQKKMWLLGLVRYLMVDDKFCCKMK
jgi:hypothetical protein